jgi:hypothetical protein
MACFPFGIIFANGNSLIERMSLANGNRTTQTQKYLPTAGFWSY